MSAGMPLRLRSRIAETSLKKGVRVHFSVDRVPPNTVLYLIALSKQRLHAAYSTVCYSSEKGVQGLFAEKCTLTPLQIFKPDQPLA